MDVQKIGAEAELTDGKLYTQQVLVKKLLTSSQEEEESDKNITREIMDAQSNSGNKTSFSAEAYTLDIKSASVKVSLETPAGEKISVTVEQAQIRGSRTEVTAESGPKQVDPLVIDLDGDGIELTDTAHGQVFDIDGNGKTEQSSFAAPHDGFLAIDNNRDGVINNGRELFGDQNGAANGYLELAKLDENRDGWIDYKDSQFKALGVYQAPESGKPTFRLLSEVGIEAISLQNRSTRQELNGNLVTAISEYRKTDGSKGLVGEAWLTVA